jgi:hypothetical protein
MFGAPVKPEALLLAKRPGMPPRDQTRFVPDKDFRLNQTDRT